MYEGYGYCCKKGESDDDSCIENEDKEGHDCTIDDVTQQGEPLYRTYWVGMTPKVCGSTSYELEADATYQVHKADSMVIQERAALTYEACHWVIGVEDNKYRDDTEAYIELRIEEMTWVQAYIYEGTNRENATAFIEGNSTAIVGAPYRAPISSKLILVMTTSPNAGSSKATFSYKVHGASEYPEW